MGIEARRISGEPSPSTRNPASLEVQTAVSGKGGVPEDTRNRLSLNHPGQGFLGRGVTDGIHVGPRGDSSAQGLFCRRKAATLVQVKRIESRPQLAAQPPASGKTGDVSGWSMLRSTPGPKPAGSNAQRSQAPVILRQGATDELAQGCTKITIRSPKPVKLSIRGRGATRIENLGLP